MRKNEYMSLDDFTSQYIGIWAPSDNHWFGLDFFFNGQEYRFHTGSMFNSEDTVLSDGRTALFGIYKKNENHGKVTYELLQEYATMEDALDSQVIERRPFREIIIDADTELLGQD